MTNAQAPNDQSNDNDETAMPKPLVVAAQPRLGIAFCHLIGHWVLGHWSLLFCGCLVIGHFAVDVQPYGC